MVPKHRSMPPRKLPDNGPVVSASQDEVPTKAEVLEDISDGYLFVRSGGKGQPIDEMHREIAEELAREELAHDADICAFGLTDTMV